MIKHFGEGISYPIIPLSWDLVKEVLRREFPPERVAGSKCSEPQIKLITLLIKHFPSLLFGEKQVCILNAL
jgi:hypothetical protein